MALKKALTVCTDGVCQRPIAAAGRGGNTMSAGKARARVIDEQRANRLLLACGVIGPPLFVIVFLIEGAMRPGYSARRHYVSQLSLGEGAGCRSPTSSRRDRRRLELDHVPRGPVAGHCRVARRASAAREALTAAT
jgi:Protein of unknown function (DUF998)